MLERIMAINDVINEIIWGAPILFLIVGGGIFFTIFTNFITFRKFGYAIKQTGLSIFNDDEEGEGQVSAFEAVSTSLAASVGTGNIAGVGTAIAIGGPGAVFWMWLAAIFGMATKYAEIVLTIEYRDRTKDFRFVGGPMYYIERGTGQKWLAIIFAFLGGVATLGIGNMVQSNSVADVLESSIGIDPLMTGIVLAVLSALVIFGGLNAISKVTAKVVPLMAGLYIFGGVLVILLNYDQIIPAFQMIFVDGFTGTAAFGGFAGAGLSMVIRYGVARGVFTNEAGLGSGPIAHAAATTDHPVRQGLWGIFEVFFDTIVTCTITALVIIMTGVWTSGEVGAALTSLGFNEGIPYGEHMVSIGLVFFAFSTILGWSYYGERCFEYLFGPSSKVIYRIIYIPVIAVGAIGGLQEIWDIADTLNGLMIIPNFIGLLWLSPVVVRLTKDFFGSGGIYEKEQQH